MRRLIMIASAAAITLATVPASHAQTRNATQCPRGQQSCALADESRAGPGQRETVPQRKVEDRADANRPSPRPGENARSGRPFQRADNSRFNAPPRGQEYRVVNEHLVLVDSDTLKVVTVLGLLNTLLK